MGGLGKFLGAMLPMFGGGNTQSSYSQTPGLGSKGWSVQQNLLGQGLQGAVSGGMMGGAPGAAGGMLMGVLPSIFGGR